MARRSDLIWNELSVVLQSGDRRRIDKHLVKLNKQKLHPLFKAALDAQILWENGNADGALEMISTAAKERKIGPHEVLLRGLIRYEKGEYEDAWEDLQIARSKDVQDGRLELARAGVLVQRGDLDGAKKILVDTINLHMNQWRAWLLLGSIEIKRKNIEGAAKAYLTVTRLAPNFEAGWTHAAGALVELGKIDKAIETLQRVSQIQPRFVTAQLGLVQLLQKVGRHGEAYDRIKSVSWYAKEPTILLQIAEYFLELKDYREVVEVLNRAQDQAEHDPKLWFLRGELARAAGPEGRANAIQHYREALIRDGNYTKARVALDELLGEL